MAAGAKSSNLPSSAKPATNPLKFKRGWQEWRDSNPRPSVLETDALPTELHSSAGPGPAPIRSAPPVAKQNLVACSANFQWPRQRNGAPHRINITNTCRRSYYSSNARNRRSPPSVVAFDRRRYKLTGYQLWTSHLAQLARTHVMSVFRRSCVTPPKTRSFQRPCARPPATRKSTPSFSAYSAITEASDRPLAGRC